MIGKISMKFRKTFSLVALLAPCLLNAAQSVKIANDSPLFTSLEENAAETIFSASNSYEKSSSKKSFFWEGFELHSTKTVSGVNAYEHYDIWYQGYSVLNGRLVLKRNRSGELAHVYGNVLEDIENDIPNAKAVFSSGKGEKDVREYVHSSLEKHAVVHNLSITPVIGFYDQSAIAAYLVSYNLIKDGSGDILSNPHQVLSVDDLSVLDKWDGAQHYAATGGGISGNEKLGLICLTPSPDIMKNCKAYEDTSGNFDLGGDFPRNDAIFNISNPPDYLIFNEFNGYPYIVDKDDDGNCSLTNTYVTTQLYDYGVEYDEQVVFSYPCDESGEYFDQDAIDNEYWYFLGFSSLNEAHFNAGITMQMYYRYFHELFGSQAVGPQADCSASSLDYCIEHLTQRVGYGGSSAMWYDNYVHYSLGGSGTYSFTVPSIVGHEITHAIVEWNSGIGNSGFAGTVHEAMADIGGMATDQYFLENVTGSFTESVGYASKRGGKKWWYAWDAMYTWDDYPDRGMRYFQWPSWDGESINDVRDLRAGFLSRYYKGGPIRKFFYGLVAKEQWSTEDAFKLLLRANSACFTASIDFIDFGNCVLSQVEENFSAQSSEEIILLEEAVDKQLQSVGIIPSVGRRYEPLDVNLQKSYQSVSFDLINSQAIDEIASIKVEWGDGSVDTWGKDEDINATHLSGYHSYNDAAGDMSVSIVVTYTDDTKRYAFRDFELFGVDLECFPVSPGGAILIDNISVQDLQYDITNSYEMVDASNLNLSAQDSLSLTITGDNVGKYLQLYVDENRDGSFDDSYNNSVNSELILSQEITDEMSDDSGFSLQLPSLSAYDSGVMYLRLVISSNPNADSCSRIFGSAVDIKLQLLESSLVDFDYEIQEGFRVSFTSIVDEEVGNLEPSFTWSYNNENNNTLVLSTQSNFEYESESAGN